MLLNTVPSTESLEQVQSNPVAWLVRPAVVLMVYTPFGTAWWSVMSDRIHSTRTPVSARKRPANQVTGGRVRNHEQLLVAADDIVQDDTAEVPDLGRGAGHVV